MYNTIMCNVRIIYLIYIINIPCARGNREHGLNFVRNTYNVLIQFVVHETSP